MKRARKKRGRGRPAQADSADSRALILNAARELFASSGYQGTTTRNVAARAGVDPALVHYFFGNKAQLFARAVDAPLPSAELRALIAGGGPELGARVVRFFVERVFGPRRQTIAAILRAAMADPESAPALRAKIEREVVAVVAPALNGPQRLLRAELIGAHFIGMFVMRHVLELEPVASASTALLAARMGPAIEQLLRPAAKRAGSKRAGA